MFCYLWWRKDESTRVKFGETWVPANENPDTYIPAYIRNSLGKYKFLWNEGNIETFHWDVSQFALKHCPERHKKHGRVDDYIRDIIPGRKKASEFHECNPDEAINLVNDHLQKMGQPFPKVGLSQNQYTAAEQVLTEISTGTLVILAALCPRFGKTLWAGMIAKETGIKLTVVASYVLTSFASFKKDLASFEQFNNRCIAIIDSRDENYQAKVKAALKEGKQVVVFISLCKGSNRQDRLDFLFNKKLCSQRLLVVDEADYGAHRKGQALPLKEACNPNDIAILMTGTNGDKAVSHWPVEYCVNVTYPELLMEKSKKR